MSKQKRKTAAETQKQKGKSAIFTEKPIKNSVCVTIQDAGADALFDCFEELRVKTDYIAGLCDALVLAYLTGDSTEHPEAAEALARTMQRNLNALYNSIERAQDDMT